MVEVIAVYGCLTNWQSARRNERHHQSHNLPSLAKFIDLPADSVVAIARLVLGAAAGLVFHPQITGVPAAIAVGAAAPALLHQLGSFRAIRVAIQDPPGVSEIAPSDTRSAALPDVGGIPVAERETTQ